MTSQEIQNYITASLREQNEKRAAYFTARRAYAENLGRGCATTEQRLNLVSLQKDYYAA